VREVEGREQAYGRAGKRYGKEQSEAAPGLSRNISSHPVIPQVRTRISHKSVILEKGLLPFLELNDS
jgi:hypothetical protein